MATLIAITNATYDTAAAAVPAPYGPLTRVTDLEPTPSAVLPLVAPNTDWQVENTAASGVTVWITYNQLIDPVTALDIIKEAHGVNSAIQEIEDLIVAMNDVFAVAEWDSLTAAPADYTKLVRAFQSIPRLFLSIPTFAYEEVDARSDDFLADFSIVQSGTGDRTIVITNVSTGLYHYILWSFGGDVEDLDGNVLPLVSGEDPAPPQFVYTGTGADTLELRLTLIGPQGISTALEEVDVT